MQRAAQPARQQSTLPDAIADLVGSVDGLPVDLDNDVDSVLVLLKKYANVPMSLADACLVRMTETLPDPVILTTDSDFRTYRRHSRQIIPCTMPT